MKKAVYDFIAQNPNTTIRKCAEALQIEELSAMVWIYELTKEGYLSCKVLPLGNGIDEDCSIFYFACKVYGKQAEVQNTSSLDGTKTTDSSGKLDMFGNQVCVGDTIMLIAQDGRYLTTETVKSCSDTRCYFQNYAAFGYQDSYRPYDALFSVTALKDLACNRDHAGDSKRDALGNTLSVGDTVLFIETGYRRFQKGTVLSMAVKSCVVSFSCDCYGNAEGRRFYRDVVSLTKLGLTDIELK